MSGNASLRNITTGRIIVGFDFVLRLRALLLVPVRLDITDVLAGVGRALPLPHTGTGLAEGDTRWRGPLLPLLLGEDVQDGAVGAAAV